MSAESTRWIRKYRISRTVPGRGRKRKIVRYPRKIRTRNDMAGEKAKAKRL